MPGPWRTGPRARIQSSLGIHPALTVPVGRSFAPSGPSTRCQRNASLPANNLRAGCAEAWQPAPQDLPCREGAVDMTAIDSAGRLGGPASG